jgi:hypothetical protein
LDPLACDPKHALDILETSLGQIVEAHQTSFELFARRHLLDREAHFLTGDARVLAGPDDFAASAFDGAVKAPLVGRVVVFTLLVVVSIPGCLICE